MKKILIYFLLGILMLVFSLTIFVSITMGILAFANMETTKEIFIGLLLFTLAFFGMCNFGKFAYDSTKLEKIERECNKCPKKN